MKNQYKSPAAHSKEMSWRLGVALGISAAIMIGLFMLPSPAPKETPEQIAERARNAVIAAQKSKTRDLCEKRVEAGAKYPSKVNWPWGWQATETPGLNVVLHKSKVELMNGFGAMIPHDVRCIIEWKGEQPTWVHYSVVPG